MFLSIGSYDQTIRRHERASGQQLVDDSLPPRSLASPPETSAIRDPKLLEVTDDHFAWLLGERDPPEGLTEAAGGIDDKSVILLLRGLVARLHRADCHYHWLIVDDMEVVGICGFKRPPNPAGEAEIGYGVAKSRCRLGYANRAVALMIVHSIEEGLSVLTAETTASNIASQIVLNRNRFAHVGRRHDEEDGEIILWAKSLSG